MAEKGTGAAGTGTGKLVSEAARDLAVRLRRDVAETVGGGCYSTGAAKSVSPSANAFVELTELVTNLAGRVEQLESRRPLFPG